MDRREFIKKSGTAAAAAVGGGACASVTGNADKLAYFGGTPVIAKEEAQKISGPMFKWPIVNEAMRKASDDVLVGCKMSGTGIAKDFEKKFAAWQGTKHALACINGTSALNTSFYAIGIKPGDEVICTSLTYWASCTGVVSLGGTVVFCDVKPDDITMDPASFEAHITPRTKAVIVVHYMGMPCDMDAIMPIAKKHGIKVVEDVSHAQGGLYKGRKLGTFGDIAAMSLMTGKSFAIGEGGILVTDNDEYYERAIRWGTYERIESTFGKDRTARTLSVPFGSTKNRLNQCAAAIGIEQLKKYDSECAEIEKSLLYFWDGLKDIDFLKVIYPKWENSNKAGWYASRGRFLPERVPGVNNKIFAQAVKAELGGMFYECGLNFPLHWSSVFTDEDIFGNGLPPSKRYLPAGVDPAKLTGELPVSDTMHERVVGDPWFKHYDTAVIDKFVEAVHKVAKNVDSLRGIKPDESSVRRRFTAG